MMSSMRRAAFLLTALLVTTASSVQAPVSLIAPPSAAAAGNVDASIAYWRRLHQSSGYSFADYARFLIFNRDAWRGSMRNAQKAMRPGGPGDRAGLFRTEQPTSGNGFARLDSLAAVTIRRGSGRRTEGLGIGRPKQLRRGPDQ